MTAWWNPCKKHLLSCKMLKEISKGERKWQQSRASLNTKDITMTYYLLMMLRKFSRAACPFYLKAWFMFFPFKVHNLFMAFLASEHLSWYSLLAPHKMVYFDGGPNKSRSNCNKVWQVFSVLLHRGHCAWWVACEEFGEPSKDNPNFQTGSSMAYTQAL